MRNILLLCMFITNIIFSQRTDEVWIDINNINIPVANDGDGSLEGGIYYDSLSIIFSYGFYLSGYGNDSLWSNGVFHSSSVLDYLPGNVVGNTNDDKNKIYIVDANSEDFDSTWQNWKDAVQQGAYFYDGNNDGEYNPIDLNGNGVWDSNEDRPDMIGAYLAWCVFNDGKPAEERTFSDVTPKGIEIGQTVFAYSFEEENVLNNVVFIRYVIENKGTIANELDSVYFSFVIDPDIGEYQYDLTGCNEKLNSTFAFKNRTDEDFGYNPPAIFVPLLQGPVEIDSVNNNGINRRGPLLGEVTFENSKNLGMVSSTSPRRRAILNPIRFADPTDKVEARHLIEGGKYHDGTPISVSDFPLGNGEELGSNADTINSKYMFSGDPVKRTGWLSKYESEWRIMNSTGPFNLTVNEPVELIYAIIIGRGNMPLNSVTVVKEYTEEIIKFYESNFTKYPVGLKQKYNSLLPKKYILHQNYPNPFNPSTIIEYSIPNEETFQATAVQLKVYDILGREVTTLFNEVKQPGSYQVTFDASALSSGMYFYELKSGNFREVKKMMLLR